ncbi:MAG TPA: type II CAAX endopeptidase family protein [Candidatus Bathyarchaeia archaeon]|nr:type II CAAX endopeptidase family protein [Candidatus Bathyarchaeia archaeon]
MHPDDQDDRRDAASPPGSDEHGPENHPPSPGVPGPEQPEPSLGLLERVNNYLLLVFACACLLMNYSFSGILYVKGLIPLSLSLPGIFAIIVPLYFLSQRSALGFGVEFSLARPHPGTLALILVISAAAILPIEAFAAVFERLWPPNADYTSFILSIKPKGLSSLVYTAIGVVLVAAFAEEMLFRGFIQKIFQRNMNGALAVVLAGFIFSLSHFNPPAIPAVAALGILFGFIFYLTGNLWYSITAHAVYNLVTLIRLYLASDEEIASSNVAMPTRTWTFVSLAILLVSLWILIRVRRPARQ